MALAPDQRADVARHVNYELQMLAAAADRLLPRPHGPTYDGLVSNAIVESLLLHARLLDEFFGAKSRGPKDRDVRARDFRPDWQRRYVLTAEEREGIDGKVMHLADDRVERFPWWPGAILVRFVDVFEEFVSGNAECELLFGNVVAEAKALARPYEAAVRAGTGGGP